MQAETETKVRNFREVQKNHEARYRRIPSNVVVHPIFPKSLIDWQDGKGKLTMWVTKEDADFLLEWIVDKDTGERKNRNNKRSNQNFINAQMGQDLWEDTGETVIINIEGYVIDGLHRITGISVTGKPQKLHFVFGIRGTAYLHIDGGSTKSAGDFLGAKQIPNANETAAAAKLAMEYINRLPEMGKHKSYSPHQILDFVLENPNIVECAVDCHAMYTNSTDRLFSSSIAATMKFLFDKMNRQKSREFIIKLMEGIGIHDNKDPVFVLRQELRRMKDNVGASYSRKRYFIMVSKTWNAMAKNEGITRKDLKIKAGEKIPVITRPK